MPGFEVLYQAAALCLTYPDDDFLARLPLLREAAPQVREFADHAAVTPPGELAEEYVRVFGAQGLYLGRGGAAPARLSDLYRAHGLECTGEERPDFLPAVLEFAARTGNTDPLTGHRDALEELRARLAGFGTPYACVLDAVCATLPPAHPGDLTDPVPQPR
ncbi:nitrate reductase molybdenum cofactor assembly chaperone [Streptomyces sp. NPDC057877]|uniref:nitrate reductase molybdenum cofactor assembly chaperone n=1 Tax=Streptomyces sp. NPDC057877 TaxID=3346269 RepID=UPI0036937B19